MFKIDCYETEASQAARGSEIGISGGQRRSIRCRLLQGDQVVRAERCMAGVLSARVRSKVHSISGGLRLGDADSAKLLV